MPFPEDRELVYNPRDLLGESGRCSPWIIKVRPDIASIQDFQLSQTRLSYQRETDNANI
jgi:hypothetical protein